MATIQLQPPPPFNFKMLDDWSQWCRRFEQFLVASGLGEQPAAKQISTLLYCLGEEAESVLTSTNATEEEHQVYSTVMGKLNAFFQVCHNMIFERARFNRQNQLLSETTEEYIMALNTLAANCNYGALEAKMICDRLVVGIRDTSLSLPPTTGPRPDVGESKKAIRQWEAMEKSSTPATSAPQRMQPATSAERRATIAHSVLLFSVKLTSHAEKGQPSSCHGGWIEVKLARTSTLQWDLIKQLTQPHSQHPPSTSNSLRFSKDWVTLERNTKSNWKQMLHLSHSFTPRRIPLPLRRKFMDKLEQMETMGAISNVDVPTPWCAGMVVTPKKSGAVQICVDLKPLNQSVLQEVHPLPKVDDNWLEPNCSANWTRTVVSGKSPSPQHHACWPHSLYHLGGTV